MRMRCSPSLLAHARVPNAYAEVAEVARSDAEREGSGVQCLQTQRFFRLRVTCLHPSAPSAHDLNALSRRRLLHPLLALCTVILPACGEFRPPASDAELARKCELFAERALEQKEIQSAKLADRIERKRLVNLGQAPVIEVLALSSGGQYGAFGVGVLQGWSTVTEPDFVRPQDFDVVTGVSTGAMIAPYAFVGTQDSIGRIEKLYAEVDEELAVFRGMFFFLPWQPAFFDNSKLRAQLRDEISTERLECIAKGYDEGRQLMVAATNLDLGKMEVFDLGAEAKLALAGAKAAGATTESAAQEFQNRFERMLLASASIPGAFEPIEIDGTLYADGGASEQFFGGIRTSTLARTLEIDKQRFPAAPPPTFRVWVIINGKVGLEPTTVQPRWTSVAFRSLQTMLASSTQMGLRRMELGSYALDQEGKAKIEFRYVALRDDFPIPETSNLFDRTLMNALLKEGRSIGCNHKSWLTPGEPLEVPGRTRPVPAADQPHLPQPRQPVAPVPPSTPR